MTARCYRHNTSSLAADVRDRQRALSPQTTLINARPGIEQNPYDLALLSSNLRHRTKQAPQPRRARRNEIGVSSRLKPLRLQLSLLVSGRRRCQINTKTRDQTKNSLFHPTKDLPPKSGGVTTLSASVVLNRCADMSHRHSVTHRKRLPCLGGEHRIRTARRKGHRMSLTDYFICGCIFGFTVALIATAYSLVASFWEAR